MIRCKKQKSLKKKLHKKVNMNVNERDSLTSRLKMTLDSLACH